MRRKLASIQRVLDIVPILKADSIELVRINGWQCVTKKGEFRVGDLGVFFEIDAIPPETEPFLFLWMPKNAQPGEAVVRPAKFRIRTMTLRGALSQGLFMPFSTFGLEGVTAGDDVTERLGVGKYEPPPPAGMGEWRGPFPQIISKTDEMRVQSVPDVLQELKHRPYAITMKYDGTSSTYLIHPQTAEFHACSRNQSIRDGANLYWEMARQYDLEAVLRRSPHLAIQGEIVGPGIQKNPLGLKKRELFVFSVFDLQSLQFLGHDETRTALAMMGLSAVETLERGDSFDYSQQQLLALAEGKYPGTTNEREGIVIRAIPETFSPTLSSRLSFKAISNRYLLKEE